MTTTPLAASAHSAPERARCAMKLLLRLYHAVDRWRYDLALWVERRLP